MKKPLFEAKCEANIRPVHNVERVDYGSPVEIITSSIPHAPRMKVPSDKCRSTNHRVNGRAALGMMEQPHASGFHPWLVFSFSYAPTEQLPKFDSHASLLAEYEPPPYNLEWLIALPFQSTWNIRDDALTSLRARLLPIHMRAIFSKYGNPHTKGRWLSERLLPRRRGASLRIPTLGKLQLFIPLFNPA